MNKLFCLGIMSLCLIIICGCRSANDSQGNVMFYKAVTPEPEWIRNAEPIEFESEFWYPQDNVDILLDTEVIPVGEYLGVQIFVQSVDVRPYNHIYTKFGKNKFRVFETKTKNDQSSKAF